MAIVVSAWRSLKTRITLGLLAIFLTGLWSLALYSSQILRSDMQRILGDQQLATISVMASEVDDELKTRLLKLELLAAHESANLVQGSVAAEMEGHGKARLILHRHALLKQLVDAGAECCAAFFTGVAAGERRRMARD